MKLKRSAKKLFSKTNGSILGYTNYQTMPQFSIDKLWNEFVLELPVLLKTLKVICKDYTQETKHDVEVKFCFIYSVLLHARWFHLSLFQRFHTVLLIKSASSKKIRLRVSFSNTFLKTFSKLFQKFFFSEAPCIIVSSTLKMFLGIFS